MKYLLLILLLLSCQEVKRESRPYYGEIDQADKEFVESQIEGMEE